MDGRSVNPLVTGLESWRLDLGMDHRRFAAHLGIDESYWSQLRHGKRAGGLRAEKLLARVSTERPELLDALLKSFKAS